MCMTHAFLASLPPPFFILCSSLFPWVVHPWVPTPHSLCFLETLSFSIVILWDKDLFWPFESLDLLSYLLRWLIMNFLLAINCSRSLFIPATSADYTGNECHQLCDFFIQQVSIENWGSCSSNLCILLPALTIEYIRSAAKGFPRLDRRRL